VVAAVAVDLFLKDLTQASIVKTTILQNTATSLGGRFHSARPQDLPLVLNGLDQLRELSSRLAALDPPSVSLPGISDAGMLKPETATAFDDALINSFVPHLSARLENDLVDFRATPKMLRERLAVAEASDTERRQGLRSWLNAQIATEPDPAVRAGLKTYGDEVLNRQLAVPIGADYIDAGRRLLAYKESLL
jgi:type VI protein secretion system component VasK